MVLVVMVWTNLLTIQKHIFITQTWYSRTDKKVQMHLNEVKVKKSKDSKIYFKEEKNKRNKGVDL